MSEVISIKAVHYGYKKYKLFCTAFLGVTIKHGALAHIILIQISVRSKLSSSFEIESKQI